MGGQGRGCMGSKAGVGDTAPISAPMRQAGARLLQAPTEGLVRGNCGEFFRTAGEALVHQTADILQGTSSGLDLVRQNGAALLLHHPSLVGNYGGALLRGNGGELVHRHCHSLLN